MTRAYWVGVSVSKITSPYLDSSLTVPTGSAIPTAISAGAASHRRPSPAAATRAVTTANVRKVRWVPRNGIRTSAESIVPTSEPAVEIAYRRPATSPLCSTLVTASRTAHGEQAPSKTSGTPKRARTANSDPRKAPAEISSRAPTERSKNGWATNGTTAMSAAAVSARRQSPRRCGCRSAKRPPSQYPTDNATRTTPIVLAQTIVEAPKNGATSRAAAISAPRLAAPTTKTRRWRYRSRLTANVLIVTQSPDFPPGPRLPAAAQAFRLWRDPIRFLLGLRCRYGDVFSVKFPSFPRLVYVADPELVKQVFTGDPRRFHAGEANATVLEPALGPNSVLILDEREHMRQRKVLLPPFHGERVRAYGAQIREIADREIEGSPID